MLFEGSIPSSYVLLWRLFLGCVKTYSIDLGLINLATF